jgi:hypothetical protein
MGQGSIFPDNHPEVSSAANRKYFNEVQSLLSQ